MKKWKRNIWIAGLCMYCVAVIAAVGGEGKASGKKDEWQTAAVPAVLNGPVEIYAGPGMLYESQGIIGRAGDGVTALSAAYDEMSGNWWVQIEWTERHETRRAYIDSAGTDAGTGGLPEEKIQRNGVVVNRTVYAYWGPGYEYTMYTEQIPFGTEGRVWQAENGFAQLEFEDGSGTGRRVWVPENALEAPNG